MSEYKRTGKTYYTYYAIIDASLHGSTILCSNEEEKQWILKAAKELGIEIPEPVIMIQKEATMPEINDRRRIKLEDVIKESYIPWLGGKA